MDDLSLGTLYVVLGRTVSKCASHTVLGHLTMAIYTLLQWGFKSGLLTLQCISFTTRDAPYCRFSFWEGS